MLMREAIRDELLKYMTAGLKMPDPPDPIVLWDATGGDGPLALLVRLDYERAKMEAKAMYARQRAGTSLRVA